MTAAGHVSVFAGMDRPLARRRITPRMLVGGAASVAALAAAWMLLQQPERSFRLDASRVTISTVTTAPFHDFIPLRGKVVPLVSVVLDAVQGGRVEEVLAEAGQHVVAGQRLIRLSDPQLELDAIARETQVIAQINSQQSLQLNFELTRTNDEKALAAAEYNIVRLSREVARRRPLAEAGFTSREKLDQSADELDYQKRLTGISDDALRRDAAVIKRSNELIAKTAARLDANLAAAKAQLDALTVRAPADGVLTALDAHVGEQKTRGQHLGQIDRDAGFKVTIQVDEFYLARVKPGQHVAVTIDGTSQRRWSSPRSIRRSRTESSRSIWRGKARRRQGCAAARRCRASSRLGDDVADDGAAGRSVPGSLRRRLGVRARQRRSQRRTRGRSSSAAARPRRSKC